MLTVLYRNLGLEDVPQLAAAEAWRLLADGKATLQLTEGLQLRRVRVMDDHRVELTGFTQAMRDRLTAYGLVHEIISWKLRFFIPVCSDGPVILDRLLTRYPLTAVADRAA